MSDATYNDVEPIYRVTKYLNSCIANLGSVTAEKLAFSDTSNARRSSAAELVLEDRFFSLW